MATIVKTPSGTWKAVIHKTGWPTTAKIEVVNDVAPGSQVILVEHADVNEEWYREAVVERWRGGTMLVPDDWPRGEQV